MLDSMEIGKELRALRERHAESTGEGVQILATKAGVSLTHWYKVEQGRSEPTVAVLSKMLAVMGHKLKIVRAGRAAKAES